MFVVKQFAIQDSNLIESAKAAIKAAFEENGYPPNAVLVHPETDCGGATEVAVMLDNAMHTIPITVRDDLAIGFRLPLDQALLDVCNPFSNLE